MVAQDPHFSQFSAQPLYLNPGFAGTTLQHRFIVNNRIQWPGLPKAFNTFAFSYDYNLSQLNSGLGILLVADKVGTASLKSTSISAIYSYKIHLANDWVVSPGIQFGYSFRDLNIQKLLFGDQLDPNFSGGQTPISIDPAIARLGNTGFVDIGAGILVYNEFFWAGVSAQHMNEPDQSLIEGDSKLPMKTQIHAGVRIPLYNGPRKKSRMSSIAPSIIYRTQGRFDQLDVGFSFIYNPIMIGVWYRGIPIQQNDADNISQDAVTFLFGLRFEKFDLSYSYDITISELGPLAGGAHEISFIYQMTVKKSRRVKRKEKFVPCPTF
jgi:type IX secretion system PorP/SprF family membrane protein